MLPSLGALPGLDDERWTAQSDLGDTPWVPPLRCEFRHVGGLWPGPRGESRIVSMDGVLIFDGNCGMCTRVRNRLVRMDRTGRLRTEPMLAPGVIDRVGVPAARLAESSWWLDSSGAVYGGAEAMNAALSTALGSRLPLRLYAVPGICCAH